MAEELDIERVFKLKYDDLKDELTKRGLQKTGTKSELQERLLQYFTAHDLSAHSLVEESVTTLEEEEEAEESLEILDTPTDLYAPVSLSNVLEDDHEKDILSETLDENTAIQTTLAKVTVAKSIPKKPVAVNLVKIKEVKPKIMSPMAAEDEKKANRTKRFGAAVSIDERKKARLEKFGHTGVTAINKSEPSTLADNDRIKKRAERFGASVDTTVDPVKKLQERKDRFVEVQIKKRQERFGVIQPAALNDLESRKQKRALKFGVK